MTLGNSVLTINRNYDQRYLLMQNSAGTVFSHVYTRDSEGKVLSISGVEDVLPRAGVTSYSHQANRLTGSTGLEAAQYSYDNNGNITSDGTRTFTYNLNNRLSKVSEGATTIAEYGYHGQNRRVFKTVFGITTYFHYDLTGNLIAETSATGTPLRDIIYQDGERVAMKVYGSGAGIYWFLNDHLGAPRAVVNDSGQVVWKAAYFPFGKAEVLVNTIENNFRLPGQYYDAETGFHYNMNRYYDPDSGRYISGDPIGLSGGINLFAYVSNDPVNFVDPEGLKDRSWPLNGRVIVHRDSPNTIRSVDMDYRKIYQTGPGDSTSRSDDVDFVEVGGVWYKIGMWNFDVDNCGKPDGGFREARPDELRDINGIINAK
jgi:RHS repeat-associated protein